MSEPTNFPPDALLRASLEVAMAPVDGLVVLAVVTAVEATLAVQRARRS